MTKLITTRPRGWRQLPRRSINLRMEMGMNQNGIIVDGFKERENVICRPDKRLTHMIKVQNKLNNNILCTFKAIKGDVATKQGVIIGRDMQFVHWAGFVGESSPQSSIVSFLVPMNNALGGKGRNHY
jgi:hypothetical protein